MRGSAPTASRPSQGCGAQGSLRRLLAPASLLLAPRRPRHNPDGEGPGTAREGRGGQRCHEETAGECAVPFAHTYVPRAAGRTFPNSRSTRAVSPVRSGGTPGGTTQPLWPAPPRPPPAASGEPGPSSSDRQPPAPNRAPTQETAPYRALSCSSSAPGMRLPQLPPQRAPGGSRQQRREKAAGAVSGRGAGGSRASPAAVRGGGGRRHGCPARRSALPALLSQRFSAFRFFIAPFRSCGSFPSSPPRAAAAHRSPRFPRAPGFTSPAHRG